MDCNVSLDGDFQIKQLKHGDFIFWIYDNYCDFLSVIVKVLGY